MTPKQVAEAGIRANEHTKDVFEKMCGLMSGWKVERTITDEEFKAYSERHQADFKEASAEEQRIWKFIRDQAQGL